MNTTTTATATTTIIDKMHIEDIKIKSPWVSSTIEDIKIKNEIEDVKTPWVSFVEEEEEEEPTLKEVLLDLCIEGDLEKVKLFYMSHNLERLDLTRFLEFACGQGDLNLAQWIQQVMPKNLAICDESLDWDKDYDKDSENDDKDSVNYEQAFYLACFSGHLHIVQWLLTIHPELIRVPIYYNHVEYVE